MRLLGVPGSLRFHSSNSALLQALALVADPPDTVTVFSELGSLPHFHPDIGEDAAPVTVRAWRKAVRDADGVVLSSPEYAHSVPGVLKNALDWLVGSGELSGKPVALLHASDRGTFARDHLLEVLRAMDASPERPELLVSLIGKPLDCVAIAHEARTPLHDFLDCIRLQLPKH